MPYQEPDFLPWDGRRVPLTLIGGYLGAGKTSLIPIAVLVNDVGAVNVDAALIRRRGADTIEFTDGCVCCSLSDGVGTAFDRLRERPVPPEHVVLELSGVAEPVRVAPWGRSAGFRLDGIVVVVDGEQLEHQLADDLVATAVTTQITSADLVMVSKADLVSTSRVQAVRAAVRDLAPDTPIVTADSGFVYAGLLDLGGGRVVDDIPPPTLFDVHTVTTVPFPPEPDEPSLHRLLDGLDAAVVRAKGVAEADDGTQYLVQVVGRRRSVEALGTAAGRADIAHRAGGDLARRVGSVLAHSLTSVAAPTTSTANRVNSVSWLPSSLRVCSSIRRPLSSTLSRYRPMPRVGNSRTGWKAMIDSKWLRTPLPARGPGVLAIMVTAVFSHGRGGRLSQSITFLVTAGNELLYSGEKKMMPSASAARAWSSATGSGNPTASTSPL